MPHLQTRLQAQAAGIPYQEICGTACFETGTVCMGLTSDALLTSKCGDKVPLILGFGLLLGSSRFEIFCLLYAFGSWI